MGQEGQSITNEFSARMKITHSLVLIFTATTLAVPAPGPAPEDAVELDDDFLSLMKEVAPLLPTSELEKRQLPTQAACYTACDKGDDGVRAFCAILPPNPIKVACFGSAAIFGSVFGQTLCRAFCNRFP